MGTSKLAKYPPSVKSKSRKLNFRTHRKQLDRLFRHITVVYGISSPSGRYVCVSSPVEYKLDEPHPYYDLERKRNFIPSVVHCSSKILVSKEHWCFKAIHKVNPDFCTLFEQAIHKVNPDFCTLFEQPPFTDYPEAFVHLLFEAWQYLWNGSFLMPEREVSQSEPLRISISTFGEIGELRS
jgi:hypothetical protein